MPKQLHHFPTLRYHAGVPVVRGRGAEGTPAVADRDSAYAPSRDARRAGGGGRRGGRRDRLDARQRPPQHVPDVCHHRPAARARTAEVSDAAPQAVYMLTVLPAVEKQHFFLQNR